MPDPTFGFPQSEENWVMRIMQDKTGMFWFGTMSGIYRYDGKIFTHFSHNAYVVNNTGVPIGPRGWTNLEMGTEKTIKNKPEPLTWVWQYGG